MSFEDHMATQNHEKEDHGIEKVKSILDKMDEDVDPEIRVVLGDDGGRMKYNLQATRKFKKNRTKAGPSSDRRLKLAFLKSESWVNRRSACCGEYVPGSCTYCPDFCLQWYKTQSKR